MLFDLDLWPTTLTWSQASQGQGRPSCQKSRSNSSNRSVPTDKRPWPLTPSLDLQPQASQGRPSYQKLMSDGSNRRVPTDKRTLPNVLSPRYAVDNKCQLSISCLSFHCWCFLVCRQCFMHILCWVRRAHWLVFGWQPIGIRSFRRHRYLKQALKAALKQLCSHRWFLWCFSQDSV